MLAATSPGRSQNLPPQDFNLVPKEINEIENVNHLDDFYERLRQLKNTGQGQVNIVHIGDSHIQADFMTAVVRNLLQAYFGNSGRGLIVPARVAGTNEPANIRSSTNTSWTSKRCVYPAQPLPIGVGGITISTTQANAVLDVEALGHQPGNGFNKLTLFYQKDPTSYGFSIRDSADRELGYIDTFSGEPFTNFTTVSWSAFMNKVSIKAVKENDQQHQATIFGINLERDTPGLLYHAIGVNGAKYFHYNAALYFSKQVQALKPDLIILSLGTNESLDYPYIDKNFSNHVKKLVDALSASSPQAKFMLISPPDAFRKKVRENPGIKTIRDSLVYSAVEHGLAFWDMYKIQGGKGSAAIWRKHGLLRPDGVHFSKDGYAYQGWLLYSAMMKGFDQYVNDRNP